MDVCIPSCDARSLIQCAKIRPLLDANPADESPQKKSRLVTQTALLTLCVTTVIVLIKLVGAYFSGSVSVLAEALQSLLDIVISAMTLVAVRIAARPPDATHPWGHGKAELVSSLIQMVVVVGTAVAIAWGATLRLLNPQEIRWDAGLSAMLVAMALDFILILRVQNVGTKHDSPALLGEVEHLRSDLLAGLGVAAGLGIYAITGWAPLDPIVAIVFTLLGAFYALKRMSLVVHELMDGSLPKAETDKVKAVLDSHQAVRSYHQLRTRRVGQRRIVGLHVLLDDDLSFVAAHDLAEEIEDALSNALNGALVTVHYEPYEAEMKHRRDHH